MLPSFGGKRQLRYLQRIGCISITGVMRSTPTAALEVALMLQPLNLFIEKEAMRTTYRLQKLGKLKIIQN
jgi:hypothetical protein